ncbi:mCG147424 [Mus musculus]|nr:mCG147424 [Mus musculus]
MATNSNPWTLTHNLASWSGSLFPIFFSSLRKTSPFIVTVVGCGEEPSPVP